MAVVFTDSLVSLSAGYPMPHQYEDSAGFKITVRRFIDAAVSQTKAAVFAPGSGSKLTSATDAMIVALCADGWEVFTVGWDISPYTPYRFTYGNDEDPSYITHWVRVSWVLHSLLTYAVATSGLQPVVIGQSRGASAAIGLAAGLCTDGQTIAVRGYLSNGSAGGGNGAYAYANAMRTINRITGTLIGLLDEVPVPVILSFGGADAYAPPDYQRRISLAIPDNAPVYMVTPGPAFGHSWMSKVSGAPIAIMWANQLWSGSTITLADGVTPAVAGA